MPVGDVDGGAGGGGAAARARRRRGGDDARRAGARCCTGRGARSWCRRSRPGRWSRRPGRATPSTAASRPALARGMDAGGGGAVRLRRRRDLGDAAGHGAVDADARGGRGAAGAGMRPQAGRRCRMNWRLRARCPHVTSAVQEQAGGGEMQKRRLGAGGPEVSAIGVGAMSFAGVYGRTSEEEAHALLDCGARPRDRPYRHLERLWHGAVGANDRQLPGRRGRRARACSASPPRPAIRRDPATGRRWFDNSRGAPRRRSSRAAWGGSGVETVDLFYVHRRDPAVPIEEVAETLAGLVRAGKTRAIGFSEIAPSSLRRAAAVHPVAAVQSEYSLCDPGAGARAGAGLRGARHRARRLLAGRARAC